MILRHYTISVQKVTSPIRIVLLTDLHSCYYGKGQEQLISAIDEQSPDLILMGGDIFDDRLPIRNTEQLLLGIAGRYPCYYVTGNHEHRDGTESFRFKMSMLKKYGVTVLSNACETITVNSAVINLCGVEDPESYMVSFDRRKNRRRCKTTKTEMIQAFNRHLDAVKAQAKKDHFTVLLSHRPELFENYVSRAFDLVLCGHAHGGQWRIPGVLNGLYAPQQGLFPLYAGGKYEKGSTTMIVSRGLAKETTPIPRIFNPPELVVITIN